MKPNSAAQLLDEKGKTDSTDQIMFADSIAFQIDTSKMVDTKDGLLVKDAIICRAMVLDYNGKKILKSPEVLADSMPTMQDDNGRASAVQGDNGCLGNKRKGSSRNGHTQ